jgi:hypothetical protein
MHKGIFAQIIFALLFGSSLAFAAAGKVTITAPTEGAMIGSNDKIKVVYEAIPGPEGDHLHLNVDGKRVDLLRQLKGTTELDPLAPGKHQICLVVNTKGHVPTGVEGCVNVTSK